MGRNLNRAAELANKDKEAVRRTLREVDLAAVFDEERRLDRLPVIQPGARRVFKEKEKKKGE